MALLLCICLYYGLMCFTKARLIAIPLFLAWFLNTVIWMADPWLAGLAMVRLGIMVDVVAIGLLLSTGQLMAPLHCLLLLASAFIHFGLSIDVKYNTAFVYANYEMFVYTITVIQMLLVGGTANGEFLNKLFDRCNNIFGSGFTSGDRHPKSKNMLQTNNKKSKE